MADPLSEKPNIVLVGRKMTPVSGSHLIIRTPGSFGVALDEQAETSGVVVAAWRCCRLPVYAGLELLIAEEEADLSSQWPKYWVRRKCSVSAAAGAGFAVWVVGDGRVAGGDWGRSVVAAAVAAAVIHWHNSFWHRG